MNERERLEVEALREDRRRLEERANDAIAIKAAMPSIVRRTVLNILDEADGLEQAREILDSQIPAKDGDSA